MATLADNPTDAEFEAADQIQLLSKDYNQMCSALGIQSGKLKRGFEYQRGLGKDAASALAIALRVFGYGFALEPETFTPLLMLLQRKIRKELVG